MEHKLQCLKEIDLMRQAGEMHVRFNQLKIHSVNAGHCGASSAERGGWGGCF